ncbi:hypothetical protein [Lysinibacillus pakistanensis]|uniref:Trigger factor n=1 Tax=Lysinibacillus pakistanensis TaxID=759811 RepID=A0AAX3X180_9BACI|nr:hypothetical protein [Lysinibacillus pakistanensis]MDM5233232.1 hypothetical protein [Lysinibacillus pakistanensis]WHY48711.1 hypothetical protein QNH22_10970 [Lysinibacillus pakistanensis]WHY53724.1 hypothetical protein QNH24_10950 [Lysinibacillus pakistanensis]
MRKPLRKTWMIASALTLGMAVFTPLQAGATSQETTKDVTIQIEQQIKGTIKNIVGDGIDVKGKDGKNYFIGFHKFSDEQIEKMNLVEGQEITVEGSVLKDYAEFYTFEVYKKELPKEIPTEDLKKLESMFTEIKKLEKEEKYDEVEKMYAAMDKITKPYVLASWQPISFEQYIDEYGFGEKNIVIKDSEKKQLKSIYEEWVKFEKAGKEVKAQEKFDEFYKILQPYLDELYPPTPFDEYMASMELDIPAEVVVKLKTIYEKAQKADKDNSIELSDQLWGEFYEVINPYFKPIPFEVFIADFDFEIRAADKKQLQLLYEEAITLDKDGKQEQSEAKWDALYKIVDPYFLENKEILISASKLTFKGQTYLPQ